MTWWVILIEMFVFAVFFTIIVFSYYRGDRKYSPENIHNYPPDIQEEYFKAHERVDVSYGRNSPCLSVAFSVGSF